MQTIIESIHLAAFNFVLNFLAWHLRMTAKITQMNPQVLLDYVKERL